MIRNAVLGIRFSVEQPRLVINFPLEGDNKSATYPYRSKCQFQLPNALPGSSSACHSCSIPRNKGMSAHGVGGCVCGVLLPEEKKALEIEYKRNPYLYLPRRRELQCRF